MDYASEPPRELNPCQYCGGTDITETEFPFPSRPGCVVTCRTCVAHTEPHYSMIMARCAWNENETVKETV